MGRDAPLSARQKTAQQPVSKGGWRTWLMLIALNCFLRALLASFMAETVSAVSLRPSCANMIWSMLNCWLTVFSFCPSYIFFCFRIVIARFWTACLAGPGFIFFI